MKSRSLLSMSIAAATLLMSGAYTHAATTSPLIALYRVNGVRDSGAAANTGVATSFLCTNWNTVTEAFQVFVWDGVGNVLFATPKETIGANGTAVVSTHATLLFAETFSGGGTSVQGSALIVGTSSQISCTAMLIDAAATTTPVGVALHAVRFNALAGSQE